jgi:cellulose biosynthesis protein BcsQ
MALANCAALLAKWGYRVLAVDWDLEAPGLERFFANLPGSGVVEARTKTFGVVDLIGAWGRNESLDWRSCTIRVPVSNGKSKLDLISAGRSDELYSGKLHALDFSRLFAERDLGSYIESLRDDWASSYDFVLIDSRTGVTDIGGICTVHLADVLILLFTTTDSSVLGLSQIVESARAARARLPRDRAALVAVPVPARDESRTEYKQSQEWKRITANQFRGLYEDWLPASVSSEDAVEILRIPYVPFWSFGEKLPVLEEGTKDPSSLGRAYEVLARLLGSRLNWAEAVEAATVAASREVNHVIDNSWLEEHKKRTFARRQSQSVRGIKINNYFEASYYCEEELAPRDQRALLDLAKRAEVNSLNPRIGTIRSSEDSKPKPRNSGIEAEILTADGENHWALNRLLDFYCKVLPVELVPHTTVSFKRRVGLVGELLTHAYRLYSYAGVNPSTRIHFTIVQSGFAGLKLAIEQDFSDGYVGEAAAIEDTISTSISFSLEDLRIDFADKLEKICNPLFILFDFQEIPRWRYESVSVAYQVDLNPQS